MLRDAESVCAHDHAMPSDIGREVHRLELYGGYSPCQGLVVPPVVARGEPSQTQSTMAKPLTPTERAQLRKDLGRAMRNARELRGYTLEDLAAKLDISFGQVGHWETGRRPIWVEDLVSVSRILHSDLPRLLQNRSGEADDLTLGEEELELIKNFRKLPLHDREQYLTRITGLAKIYGDPVPDERLPAVWSQTPKTKQRTK